MGPVAFQNWVHVVMLEGAAHNPPCTAPPLTDHAAETVVWTLKRREQKACTSWNTGSFNTVLLCSQYEATATVAAPTVPVAVGVGCVPSGRRNVRREDCSPTEKVV